MEHAGMNTGGIVSTGKPHLIGEEGSHCPPFIEHTTDAGMLMPQPLFIEMEATEEKIEAVAKILRKAMHKEIE